MRKSRLEGSFVARVVGLLAEERQRQGMSHERLAEAAGVHRSTISRTERGLMNPTLYVVRAISGALKLDLAKIIEEADTPNKGNRKPHQDND